MSSLLFIAQSNKDPYLACLNGVSTHPHYHDCENCEHVANKTCDCAREPVPVIVRQGCRDFGSPCLF